MCFGSCRFPVFVTDSHLESAIAGWLSWVGDQLQGTCEVITRLNPAKANSVYCETPIHFRVCSGETLSESSASKQHQLVEFVRQAGRRPATLFAHLWAYFSEEFRGVGLRVLESKLVSQRLQPYQLRRRVEDFDNMGDALGQVVDDREMFDIVAASFLKECDVRVAREKASILPTSIETFDAQHCVVRQRQNYLAEIYGQLPLEDESGVAMSPVFGNRGQGMSMFSYARRCVAIRLPRENESLHLRFMRLDWQMEVLFNEVAFNPESEYRVLMWPLPEIEVQHAGLLDGDAEEVYSSLDTPKNETQVIASATRALETARDEHATILVLPELTVSPGVEQAMREYLANEHSVWKPLLTVYGRTHVCNPQKKRCDLNQGVVLDVHGEVICEHLKTIGFGIFSPDNPIPVLGRDRPNGVSERIETGTEFTLIETPLGVMVPMICKDLLNTQAEQLIAGSHADTILVPSLSPHTKAHSEVAKRLRIQQWISTFVSNRCLDRTWKGERVSWQPIDGSPLAAQQMLGEGASFFQVPRPAGQPGMVVCGLDNPTIPYLLFTADLV